MLGLLEINNFPTVQTQDALLRAYLIKQEFLMTKV
ncbi:odorant binding protein 14 [Manduca sexta]|uniref:Odorant binding protein 14 n=1 Tax=Manduca sexta TaxID=7130 RepID=A0A922CCY9_MANSE|nr:odorant binding protein 14 [Manduca sexta]